MKKPKVKKLREFNSGFESYTYETSKEYAEECQDMEDLTLSIDDNLTVAMGEYDTRQVWHYDDNNDLVLSTFNEETKQVDAFLKIEIPDSWK